MFLKYFNYTMVAGTTQTLRPHLWRDPDRWQPGGGALMTVGERQGTFISWVMRSLTYGFLNHFSE